MAQLLDLLRAGGSTSTVSVMHACRPIDCGYQLLRLGGAADGGYLVPDDLHGLRALFSPGVAESSALELDFAGRGIPCFLADRSVAGPAEPHPLFHFTRKHLGTTNDSSTIRLADWIDAHCPGSDDLALQMDIEGAEYAVIDNAQRALLRRFRIIVVELHHLDAIGQPFVCRRIGEALAKLHLDFVPVHLHPNNYAGIVHIGGLPVPPLLEVTYLRRDRCLSARPRTDFPHPLDRDNVSRKRQAVLPREWYA